MTDDPTSSKISPGENSLVLVHTTCTDRDEAERLASELVESRLAACASIGQPVVSVYPWEGRIERETETPLTLKTTRAAFGALRARLNERHSYDVPELLAVAAVDGNADYIQWVHEWVAGGQDA